MRTAVLAVILLVAYCKARPSFEFDARPLFGSSYIVGGQDADPAEFPWQLSQEHRSFFGSWSHSCGASLLSANYALSAAHCVDGESAGTLRVLAGTNVRGSGVVANVASYQMHENWNDNSATFANDIAILVLASPIAENGGSIQYAQLPADNSDQFVGETGIISGWGRTSASNFLPLNLQKASISVISTDECNQIMSAIPGGLVTGGHICLFDTANQIGSCNGDSGGPFSLGSVVAGVTSFGVQSGGACAQTFPTIYTRTSAYLDWIQAHTQ